MRTDAELLDGLEALARSGAAPALVNDDNGHWACMDEGVQSISEGSEPADMQFVFWIPADRWRETARQAIESYLDAAAKDEAEEEFNDE